MTARRTGVAALASNAWQAPERTNSKAIAATSEQADPAMSDFPEGADGTDHLTTTECPGCGRTGVRTLFHASDRLYRTTDQSFRVVECSACRLIRLEPRPTLEELSRYYPAEYWYAPDGDTTSRMEERYRRLVLRDHVKFILGALEDSPPDGLLVDVGCGGGLLLRMLQERGLHVLGLETSQAAAASAWRQNRVPVVRGDLANSPIPRGACAALTMFHVLEHLLDPMSYLTSAREALQPGGRLIVQVPNASSWQFLVFGEHWNGVDVPRHLLNFRQRDLERLLEHCGFEIVRRKHFSLRDNPAGFASSVAPALDPMARRVRRIPESPAQKLLKDLLYFGIALASLPFTFFEAACGAGSTIMIEARRKA